MDISKKVQSKLSVPVPGVEIGKKKKKINKQPAPLTGMEISKNNVVLFIPFQLLVTSPTRT
jgi:hypothetical protein